MRLSFLYPENQENFAQQAIARLGRLSNVDVSIVAIAHANLRQELQDSCDGDELLVLALSKELLAQQSASARELWAPLLLRVETGRAKTFGIILLDDLVLPPLLQRALWAHEHFALRALEAWVIAWSIPHPETAGTQAQLEDNLDEGLHELLLRCLVDESASLLLSCTCANTRTRCATEFALRAGQYFEAVKILYVPHRVAVLRDGVMAQIAPAGRTLWILNGYEGPLPERPEDASILILGATGGIVIPATAAQGVEKSMSGVLGRALQLIALIPNVAGVELPFSTFELEELLPWLYENHWILAERLARKAGVFFRVNRRAAEAIWLYEELKQQAEQQGKASCVVDCDNELYWLRAGGSRKLLVCGTAQGSLDF